MVVSTKQVLPVFWNNNYKQMEGEITNLVPTSVTPAKGEEQLYSNYWNIVISSGLLHDDTEVDYWCSRTPGCLSKFYMNAFCPGIVLRKQCGWCFPLVGPLETIQKDTKNCSGITNHNLIHRLPGARGRGRLLWVRNKKETLRNEADMWNWYGNRGKPDVWYNPFCLLVCEPIAWLMLLACIHML